MIELITGRPGHGKTLWAVTRMAEERAKDAARPLYVCGIRDLKIDSSELAAGEDWQSVPDGSIVVIDECQSTFPQRGPGTPPPHVAAMATHRHRGIDFLLITQHPGNIDKFVRELSERHTHVVRMMGNESAMVYTWTDVQTDPRSEAAKSAASTRPWTYPKSSYALYSSAVLHTGKRRLPWVAIVAICSTLLAPFALYAAYHALPGTGDAAVDVAPAESAASPPPRAGNDDWQARYKPRIAHRPESAPIFDKIAPKRPPVLYCVDVEMSNCRCYTDQMALWSGVDQGVCKELARYPSHRYFD